MQSAFDQILYSGHPSIGTKRAVFIFALGMGPTRVFHVEAQNPSAVLLMERLLLGDGKVSDNCQVLSVVRDHRSLGTRGELAMEIPFVDFLTDIVDLDKLMADVVTAECLRKALTDEERRYMERKLALIEEEPEEELPDLFEEAAKISEDADDWTEESDVVPVRAQAIQDDHTVQLTAALVGLGFKKPEVRKFVVGLGTRVRTDSLHGLLKDGIRTLGV